MKRGTEDLDFFIGDEALAAANGPGAPNMKGLYGHGIDSSRLWNTLSNPTRTNRKLGRAYRICLGSTELTYFRRITWKDSGRIRYSNTYALSQRITTSCLRSP